MPIHTHVKHIGHRSAGQSSAQISAFRSNGTLVRALNNIHPILSVLGAIDWLVPAAVFVFLGTHVASDLDARNHGRLCSLMHSMIHQGRQEVKLMSAYLNSNQQQSETTAPLPGEVSELLLNHTRVHNLSLCSASDMNGQSNDLKLQTSRNEYQITSFFREKRGRRSSPLCRTIYSNSKNSKRKSTSGLIRTPRKHTCTRK